MAFWSRLLRRSNTPQPFMTGDDAYSGLAALYGPPSAERITQGFERFARLAYAGNSTVYACIAKRMSLFSEATFKWRRLSDKNLFGDASLSLLEYPWPNGSAGDLLSRMELDVSLAGNAYIRRAGDRLERLRPDWVTIVSEVTLDDVGREVREVIGYLFDPIGDPERHLEYIPVDEVAHWAPMPDPFMNWLGMSWITPIMREINADIRMNEFRDAYFSNAATPNLLIKYKDKVSPERIQALRDMISARHTGSLNAFTTLVLDQGADPMVVGASMEGSSFDALAAAGETRIAAAAGVPPLIAGFREGLIASRPGEYAQAMRSFADLTMRPLWRSACAALEKLLQVPAGAELWFDVSDVSALRQGELDFANTMAVQATTINTLIMAGYTADSVTQAVNAGDLTLLIHTGLTSVQMHKPGESPPVPDGQPTDTQPTDANPPAPDDQGG